jgi:hypothetical protein
MCINRKIKNDIPKMTGTAPINLRLSVFIWSLAYEMEALAANV